MFHSIFRCFPSRFQSLLRLRVIQPFRDYWYRTAPSNHSDNNEALQLRWQRTFPGFGFSKFRNVAGYQYNVDERLSRIRLRLTDPKPVSLNFNYISIWERDSSGMLNKVTSDYQCGMSSVADVLPDPSAVMRGGIGNSVQAHSKRELHPWWEIRFSQPVNVAYIEFFNRKDIFGMRAASLVIDGFDLLGRRVYCGGRAEPSAIANAIKEQGLALISRLYNSLTDFGFDQLKVRLEKAITHQLSSTTSTDGRVNLLKELEEIESLVLSPTPDIGGSHEQALNLCLPPGTRYLRVVGFRRWLPREASLSIRYGKQVHRLTERPDIGDYQESLMHLRDRIWSLQHPHIFELQLAEFQAGGEVNIWFGDSYCGDVFVQRLIEVSRDGKSWKTIDTTLDRFSLSLDLLTLHEWVLGEKWSLKFVKHLGQFLATYRMSQARTVKPLLRNNRSYLPDFFKGVEAGGSTARYLPRVMYTRHGLTVPFSELDSSFLAERMHRFTHYLKETFDLDAFPCYGTLLGMYRDGDFLPHDDDIDLATIVDLPEGMTYRQATEQWAEKLKAKGLNCRPPTPMSLNLHCYFEDFDMDLFFIYRVPDDTKSVWTHMEGYQVRKVKRALIEPLSSFEFKGFEFYAPAKIEGFLEDRYGEGWVTPDPTYEL